MSLIDRLRGAVQAFGSLVPQPVKGMPPNAGLGGSATKANTVTSRIANSVDALFGRLSYSAGPQFTRYSSYPATALDPQKIYAILREADNGFPLRKAELDEQILERDGHLRGIDYSRRYEVSGKPFRVQPRNETPLAISVAKFVRASIDEIDSFDHAIEDLLSANGQGYSAAEIVWHFDALRFTNPDGVRVIAKTLVPHSLSYVHQKHFRFDLGTDEPYLVMSGGDIALPPNKFVFHDATGTGLIEKRGFMRVCAVLHAAKQWSLRDWLVYEHMYGIPQLEGIYEQDRELSDLDRSTYEAIVRDYGQGIPAIHPDNFQIKITPPPSGGKSDDVHGALIGWANAEMSKCVLGSTLTVEMGGVGSYNASETHADVRHAIVRADARKLATTIRNQLFVPIIEMNMDVLASLFGATPEEIRNCVPTMAWRIDRETTPSQRAQIISMAINDWGMEVDSEQQRDEFGIDAPRPGSNPLPGKPQAVSSGGVAVGSLEASRDGVQPPKEPAQQP